MEIIENILPQNFELQKNKKQIVLTHTSRNLIDYMVSLKHRFNGKPKKLPHYLVSRDGKVIKVLEDLYNGNFTSNQSVNQKSIIICLENYGWLEKVSLKNYYSNWIGNIYKEKVFDRKWRDYFFWHPYTEVQLEKLAELCKKISQEYGILLNFVGHNTKVKGIESFLGIITRSNFDEFATDLSPAFDYERFKMLLKDE
jgi:N-acetyl-anhydromuramyl-L-alanine amidase AmpD